jgi:peptidoglycan/LPS O-acetylase OafA/YrhL
VTGQRDKSHYYPSLDGLRGVAVLMVVYGHAGYRGWVPLVVGCATTGVILFFFLSGFLMASHYLPDDSLKTRPREALRYWLSFLARRFVRVYPPFFCAPVVGFLLLMPNLPPDFGHAASGVAEAFDRFIRLVTFQAKDPGIYWTIKVELTFYLLYPFLIAIFVFFRRSVWSLAAIFVGLAFLNHFRNGIGDLSWNVWLLSDEGGFIALFVAGVLTAVARERLPPLPRLKSRHWNALAGASLVVFFAAVGVLASFKPTWHQIWQKEWLFAPLLFVLFIALGRTDGAVSRLLSSRAGVMLGRVSYSIYLTHIIAFALVGRMLPHFQNVLTGGLMVAAVATINYLAVERPFVRLSKRIRVSVRPAPLPIPAAAAGATTR